MKAGAAVLALCCGLAYAAAEPPASPREQLYRATAGELFLCHLRSKVAAQGGHGSREAMQEAARCGSEAGLRDGLAAYRRLQGGLSAPARAALRDYMAAWQGAMKSTAGSMHNPAAQAAARARLEELWARFMLE